MPNTPEKKRPLITTDSFFPRWNAVAQLLKEVIPFPKNHLEVVVLVSDFPGSRPKFPGARYVTFPTVKSITFNSYSPSLPILSRIQKETSHADVIFGNTVGPISFIRSYYAKRQKKPVLSFIHSIAWNNHAPKQSK